MIDAIPTKVWLLAGIVALAFPSLRYLWREAADRRARRVIGGRRGPTNWRTPWGIRRSIGAIVVLAALAVFLWTPFADELAELPIFVPLICTGIGAVLALMVVRGLALGTIRPISENIFTRYERRTQPARYWASTTWNGTLAVLLLALGIWLIASAPHDALVVRCTGDDSGPQDAITACSRLLARPDGDRRDRAEWLAARGVAKHRGSAIRSAMADYRESLRLDPAQSHTHYNLALTQMATGDPAAALRELDAAARIDPDDLETRMRRYELYMQAGRPRQAIDDLTDFHRRHPGEPIPIATRGLIHAALRDERSARADFAAARAIEPGNIVALRGDAMLAMQANDWPAAITALSAVLAREPGDRWLLASRAEAYRRTGDAARAAQDLAALDAIRAR